MCNRLWKNEHKETRNKEHEYDQLVPTTIVNLFLTFDTTLVIKELHTIDND